MTEGRIAARRIAGEAPFLWAAGIVSAFAAFALVAGAGGAGGATAIGDFLLLVAAGLSFIALALQLFGKIELRLMDIEAAVKGELPSPK